MCDLMRLINRRWNWCHFDSFTGDLYFTFFSLRWKWSNQLCWLRRYDRYHRTLRVNHFKSKSTTNIVVCVCFIIWKCWIHVKIVTQFQTAQHVVLLKTRTECDFSYEKRRFWYVFDALCVFFVFNAKKRTGKNKNIHMIPLWASINNGLLHIR